MNLLGRRSVVPRHEDRKVQGVVSALESIHNAARSGTIAARAFLAAGELIVIAASSPVTVPHTLGRAPVSFSYCVWASGGVVNGSVRRTASTSETITLRNDATVEVTIRAEVA